MILAIIGFLRELFGSGSLLGFPVVPKSFFEAGYYNNGMMIMPPMALIIVGIIIWVQRSKNPVLVESK
jgi:Na+-transporting NADH:ubiquinone oxidoreductase subunit D